MNGWQRKEKLGMNDLLCGELAHLTAETPEIMAEKLLPLEPGYGVGALS
jgi:hypothetical protein